MGVKDSGTLKASHHFSGGGEGRREIYHGTHLSVVGVGERLQVEAEEMGRGKEQRWTS